MKLSKIVSFFVVLTFLLASLPVPEVHATGEATDNSQVGTWTFCANEGGTCSFPGTKLVRYGANGIYSTVTGPFTNSVACTNAVFGDPTPGVVKTCEYSDPVPPTLISFTRQNPATSPTNADILIFRATFSEEVQNVDIADFAVNSTSTATVTNLGEVGGAWIFCANEGGTCSFTGTRLVRYGANGTYFTGTFTGSVACTNAQWGDPIFGVVKTCEFFATDTYDVTVSGGDLASYNGTVGLNLAAGQNIQNLVGTALPAGEPTIDEIYILDNAGPSVTVNQASGQADPTNASPIDFTVVFNESIDTTTFTAADMTLGGTAPGTLSAVITEIAPNDGTTFNIAVSGMTGSGTVTASIAANTVQDPLGNNNTASTSTDNSVTYDGINPTVVTTSLAATYTTGPSTFTVTFSKDVGNAGGGTGADDVENPANYLLVEDGVDGAFDTVSCGPVPGAGGVQPDDTKVTVDSVVYNSGLLTSTLGINGGTALPDGTYRLFVCGTTSIVDLAGNPLNGGVDYTVDFTVQAASGGGGGGTGAGATSLPATGFPMGKVTKLPVQPASKAYVSTDLILEIPALGQKMNIVGVPQSDDSWDVTWLGNNAGYLAGSAFPTWSGNTVITGHVWDAWNQPGPFAQLKMLKHGDQIKIHAFGQVYTYEVRESKLVTSRNVKAVLQHEEYDWVTLLSCEYYNPFTGGYLFRRAVRAVLVSVK